MHYLDCVLPTLAENLALDEALLLEAEHGGPEVLRLWEWPTPAVVLGAAGRVADEVHEDHCRADGVPILRRASGGGAVVLGQGCLLYSLVLAYQGSADLADVRLSYCHIFGRLTHALTPLVAGVACAGTSDLALHSRKFSGNSQQRKRDHLLHHGTLLYAFDIDSAGRYLKAPPRQPEYRGGRTHAAFLRNVPVSAQELRTCVREVWGAHSTLSAIPEETVRRLVREKYERPDWTYRR
jgi:lipoate---protein ligase